MSSYIIKEETLTSIADAIREKSGSTDTMKPTDMANNISNLTTLPANRLILTGDLGYVSYYGCWDWFFQEYEGLLTSNNISNMNSAFFYSNLSTIPFEININTTSTTNLQQAFYCSKITDIPVINGRGYIGSVSKAFYQCEYLTNVPNDFWIDCSVSSNLSSMFQNCRRLRKLPIGFLNRAQTTQATSHNYSYSVLNNCGNGCYVLDDLVGLTPSNNATYSSNVLNGIVSYAYRLKDLIFAYDDDGAVFERQWKGQTLDLTYNVGYGSSTYPLTMYGLTNDTKITNDENYQLLKDNPDAWTVDIKYSRYNHDSAVRTINSLPDTSAYLASKGGTNTIKFKGASGSATDGGAINTLTEEEIAVATAKGWTVSLA